MINSHITASKSGGSGTADDSLDTSGGGSGAAADGSDIAADSSSNTSKRKMFYNDKEVMGVVEKQRNHMMTEALHFVWIILAVVVVLFIIGLFFRYYSELGRACVFVDYYHANKKVMPLWRMIGYDILNAFAGGFFYLYHYHVTRMRIQDTTETIYGPWLVQ